MESNNELITENRNQLNSNSFPFDFQRFDFLLKCLPKSGLEFGLNANQILITCFDVNNNYFIFGTNVGLIYCLRRHVFNSKEILKYRLISSSINVIKLITDELLSFATESGVYVFNRLNQKFLYGWKCPTKANITCIQTFTSISDQKLLLISGDSDGFVRFHDLQKCQQNCIFKDFGQQIIQIEFIDSKTLLISSSLKTVVIGITCLDWNQQKSEQIGKNERKSCGKFGAVYSHNSNIIFGSRPSLHLIKAELNGNVIETIRINNIEDTECPQLLEEFIPKPITGQTHYKLGVLKLFCDDQYIISTNDSNLLIIRTDGQFCIKEKIERLVDIKISAVDSYEAFVLLESNYIIRIRSNQMASHSDFETSNDSEISSASEGKSTDTKSSAESLINLFKGPVNGVNPISFLDEELKKVFDFNKIQLKLTKKYNQLSASIISTIDPNLVPISDKNVFLTPDDYYNTIDTNSPTKEMPDFSSPIVVTRKVKRKPQNNSNESNLSDISPENDCQNLIGNHFQRSDNKLEPNGDISGNNQLNSETNEDNRLEMILSAYKEANPSLDTTSTETEINEVNGDEEEVSQTTGDNQGIGEEVIEKNVNSITNVIETEDQRLEEQKSVNENNKYFEQKWKKIFNFYDEKNVMISSFCATGYNSRTEIGLIWFVPKDDNSLLYYPTLDSLKLMKVRAIETTSATYELFVLSDSGVIYKREGMDATKPVGTKWTQIRGNKSKAKLTSICLNPKDSILWCCDSNGETWTHQIKGQKWSKINDFSSHSIEMRKVSVSSFDSSIVWGIDKNGKVFVRTFSKSGDNGNNFSGDEWLLIDGILAKDIVVCCDNSVLIAVQNNLLFRRSAKIKPNDRINEWQAVNGPDVPINDSYSSLSVTENNEICILTASGALWHTYRPSDMNSTHDLDDTHQDWLLI